MPEPNRQTDGHLENPSVRFEPTDAKFNWILGIILVALVLGVIIHVLILFYFFRERAVLNVERKSPFPLTPRPSRALPPEPRLEPLDRAEEITSSNVYLREKARLERIDSYATTQEKGYVRIPIDQAMRLLADKLPSRGQAGPRAAGGAGAVGLLVSPAGPGPLLAAAALFPGKDHEMQASSSGHDNGLVDGGASNSGRLFRRRNPQWLGR